MMLMMVVVMVMTMTKIFAFRFYIFKLPINRLRSRYVIIFSRTQILCLSSIVVALPLAWGAFWDILARRWWAVLFDELAFAGLAKCHVDVLERQHNLLEASRRVTNLC